MFDFQTNPTIHSLIENIEKVIVGKRSVIINAIVTLLCRGHLLIEDVPGLGKTMLARAISRSIDFTFKRIQFTPDLLPSDITGFSIYNQKTGEFEFKQGPIFTNVLLADEINRATPRTQSSLLECMQEGQVTVDGITYIMEQIFFVIATQNPIELHGTYQLPEAQLDRFFMRIEMGYPSTEEEADILESQEKEHPINTIKPVFSIDTLREMQKMVQNVHIERPVLEYIVKITNATRTHSDIAIGASPRGSLSLMLASKAIAFLKGDDFVEPTLAKQMAKYVLSHRIIIKPISKQKGATEALILKDILSKIEPPIF